MDCHVSYLHILEAKVLQFIQWKRNGKFKRVELESSAQVRKRSDNIISGGGLNSFLAARQRMPSGI